LNEGDAVSFEVVESDKGLKAQNVQHVIPAERAGNQTPREI